MAASVLWFAPKTLKLDYHDRVRVADLGHDPPFSFQVRHSRHRPVPLNASVCLQVKASLRR
jgi:hypothetical protein